VTAKVHRTLERLLLQFDDSISVLLDMCPHWQIASIYSIFDLNLIVLLFCLDVVNDVRLTYLILKCFIFELQFITKTF